ncbi:MAG: hypothetical protein QM820_32730 [Minicystis sp.]
MVKGSAPAPRSNVITRRLGPILLLAITTAAPAARAQTPPAADPPAKAPAADPPAKAADPPAQAPAPAADASKADALFQEGKRLFEQNNLAAACNLLARSDALDPSVGALGLLAACHEQQGKLAAALREYRETARRAEAARDARGEFARQRAAALDARVPKLLVRLVAPAPGTEVRRDGERWPASAIGAEIPVDPGPHEITVTAPGRVEQRVRVLAKEGAVVTVDVPELAPVAPAAIACPPPPPETAAQRLGARLPAAIVTGGVGLVGLGVGIGFGVAALNKNVASNTLHDTCKLPGAAPGACAAGRDARDAAYRAGTISTVGFGVAAAGAGVAAALLLWPRDKATPARAGLSVTPLVGTDGGGALVRGRF